MLDDAAAAGAQRAEAVGVVDHQPGALALGRGGQRRQVGEVAVHAEHPVGDHQGVALGLVQALGQAVGVVVQVARETRAGKQPGIQQRGVVEAVFEHRVALPDQRGDGGQVGHVAGGEQQRARPSGEVGERFFQFVVRTAVADH
ncbi:hypothetical protein D9M70_507150 [compost metagenome]